MLAMDIMVVIVVKTMIVILVMVAMVKKYWLKMLGSLNYIPLGNPVNTMMAVQSPIS